MSGFLVPNYTIVPNEFFVMLPQLSESESKCLLVIMRETFGYHKTGQKLAVSVLMEKTGLCNSAVIDATLALCNLGILRRKFVDGMYYYEVVISDEVEEQVVNPNPKSGNSQQRQSGNSSHIKRNVNPLNKDLKKITIPYGCSFDSEGEIYLQGRLLSIKKSQGRGGITHWQNVAQRDDFRSAEKVLGKTGTEAAIDKALRGNMFALKQIVGYVVKMAEIKQKEPPQQSVPKERQYR